MSMTLAYPLLQEPLVFEENRIQVLVVESPSELRKMILSLQQQEAGREGEFVLGEKFLPLEFSKYATLITDPFALDFAAKKIATKLNQQAMERAGDMYAEQFRQILAELNELAAGIGTGMEFEVSFSEFTGWEGLIKLMNFHIDRQTLPFSEQVLEYIRLQQRVFAKKLVILYNLKACLTLEELKHFYQAVKYEKLCVLLLEDRQRTEMGEDENVTIIDKDLCIF